MDEQVKVCPECGAEFFAYVTECNRCESELVSPEEVRGPSLKKTHVPGEGLACVEDGTYERANEVAWALRSAGFEASVLRVPGGSSCKGSFGVFVERGAASEAMRKIQELWKQANPEIAAAEERIKKGMCPACGALLMGSSEECPDCGLFLGEREGECDDHGGGCGSCK
ncbi:MAG: hypothetical protein QY316_12230 [Thermodesulfobacteriota bacterium]|nr:MAG: hypothetical protein QY316_12230 [Thermodesulfobacteriota bacterium]